MNCKEYQDDLKRLAENDAAAKATQEMLEVRRIGGLEGLTRQFSLSLSLSLSLFSLLTLSLPCYTSSESRQERRSHALSYL